MLEFISAADEPIARRLDVGALPGDAA